MTVDIKVPLYEQVVEDVVERTKQRALARIDAQAKVTAPADTGFYRRNIRVEGDEVVANAEYSSAIEYGFANFVENVSGHTRVVNGKTQNVRPHTRVMNRNPNPVMRNAGRAVQKEVEGIFLRELSKRV